MTAREAHTNALRDLQDVMDTAWTLGLTRHATVNANARVEEIAAQVVGYHGAEDDHGRPVIGTDLSNGQVVAIAQTYFDGLAVSYGLQPGEIVVWGRPAWARVATAHDGRGGAR